MSMFSDEPREKVFVVHNPQQVEDAIADNIRLRAENRELAEERDSLLSVRDDAVAHIHRLEAENRELAAKVAVLVEALTVERDHWRSALTAWRGNETVDVDYGSALAAETRLTALLDGGRREP